MGTARSLASSAKRIYNEDGWAAVARATYMKGHRTAGERVNYGDGPYDREWDVLIVLDACRYDLFEQVVPHHPISESIEHLEPIYSHASTSEEWMAKSFTDGPPEDVADTYYISGNGWSKHLDPTMFAGIENVAEYGIDSEYSIVPSDPVTDAAIDCYRNSDAERYIIHYIPPHAPFYHCAGKYSSTRDEAGGSQNVWNGLRRGEYDRNEVWADYGKHLLNVLDHVSVIIENVSGHVAITADHGNALGEFGVYGHPGYCLVPSVKRVPWATATGEGKETYTIRGVRENATDTMDEGEIDEHLRDLGYIV